MKDEEPNLPAQFSEALVYVSKEITPNFIKAADRLLGGLVDIPAAWLAQQKAKIDAKTQSYRIVETSIGSAAALSAGTDKEIVERAMSVLVGKAYRKQTNRDSVARAMIEDLIEHSERKVDGSEPAQITELDDDWLNVFERYAEDASSERLQGLWGRVLSGEIRRPGRYSTRTLRFLSEFSQADALNFETFANCSFGDGAPKSLVLPSENTNLRHLIELEANGLIQGVIGLGLYRVLNFNSEGYAIVFEGDIAIVFKG